MHSKKYYIVYGLFFSLIVAAVLCLCLTIMQGMPHIDPMFYLMSFGVAFVTSFVVTAVLPLARIAAACAVYYDAKPGSVAFRLIQNVFFSTLIMFVLGIVMTAFMTGVGEVEAMSTMTGQMMGTNLFDRFVSLCLQFWPTIVIVAFLSDPAAGGLAGAGAGMAMGAQMAKELFSAPGASPGAPQRPAQEAPQSHCPGCGAPALDGAKFCHNCGAPLPAPAPQEGDRFCPKCRKMTRGKFCPDCGTETV